jgi:phenylpropionate dioxygenase-like ring-hydroxylating dioxygenase large terminal subunit
MNTDTITDVNTLKGGPLFGFWYPALPSGKLRPGTLRPLLMLGLPILLCRDRQGKVAAMRDLCPHRGMPLSFGRFDGERVECAFHGWQFDTAGRCRHIPALVGEGTALQAEKIGVTSYPCEERDHYIWVYLPDGKGAPSTMPDVTKLPILSEPYRFFDLSLTYRCNVDEGVVGLVDPAHGPFVHQSFWWRRKASVHEKTKLYEPIPNGFRMVAHAPSQNSGAYKLLTRFYGGPLTTTIDFVLPNQRYELIQCGSLWISTRLTVTPTTDQECRADYCAAWNCFPWLPFGRFIFRQFTKMFLSQDKIAFERQAIGFRYKPSLMLVGDADMPAKWYYKLKAAHLASVQTGQSFDHPLKERVTLRWKS